MGEAHARTGRAARFWRPGNEFDPAAVARVTWLAATLSTPALLIAFPPTAVAPALGWAVGWSWAAFHVVVLGIVARQRAARLRVLYAASLVDIAMLAVVQWLAGGWSTPYHLFVFVNVYAVAVSQPRRRTLLAAPLALVATFAPVLYGGTDGRGADVVVAAGLWAVLSWLGTDVTSVIARQRRALERAATHDVLTGLDNRRAFTDQVDALLERSRAGAGVALVGIGDVDLFKAVNDRHGHRAGDECLRAAAQRVDDACRREDAGAAVYRWGGDEFVVVLVLRGTADVEAVRRRVGDRLALVETPVDGVPGVGLTFGWAVWDGRSSGERTVELADRQLVARKGARFNVPGRRAPAGRDGRAAPARDGPADQPVEADHQPAPSAGRRSA